MAENILELQNIGKTFSGVNVLRNINFQLRKGEVHALLGENGAGKSTLIKIISGYHQPDAGGKILVNGKEVTFKDPRDSMAAHIHTIYQELTLCRDMTVAENIVFDKQHLFPGIMTAPKAYYDLAKKALDRLGSDIDPNAYVRELSIAQQQVVEIAKAISANASVILMDEPTSSISERDAQKLMEIIRSLRDEGVSIIYISHRLHEINGISDRVTVLRDGDHVGTLDVATSTTQDYISLMVGREMGNAYPKAEVELGEVVLKVENLTTDVFSNVSFEVREGQILGIGGLVGAKRSEVLETLFGLRPIVSGKIWLYGKEFVPGSPMNCVRNGMAFATEDRKKTGLVLCLSVADNVNMVNIHDIISSKYGIVNGKKAGELAQKYRKQLNIKLANTQQAVSTLSGGNQQKVVLAKWLEIAPRVILFDEPTRGIDIGAKAEIYTIMGELAKQGVAIVMVSSELPELLSVTDNILVMCEGKMMGLVPREEATQESIMALAAAAL